MWNKDFPGLFWETYTENHSGKESTQVAVSPVLEQPKDPLNVCAGGGLGGGMGIWTRLLFSRSVVSNYGQPWTVASRLLCERGSPSK